MAFSATKTRDNVVGNIRVAYYNADFDTVTAGHISTGFSTILFAEFLNEVTENDGRLQLNIADDGSTAEAGGLYCSGFTSNDTAIIKVEGY